jgi:ankyrin repeat protein
MELYGTPLDDEEGDRRAAVRDVTIIASPDSLRHLAKFLEQIADEIDEYGARFDHDHYQLFASRDLGNEYWGGDVTVLNPSFASREDLGDAFLSRLPPLVRAARLGDDAAVVSLLAAGEDPNEADEDGFSALQAACVASVSQIVKRLLDAGAGVEAGSFGSTPLMAAAAAGSLEIVDMLLTAGADIHAKCEWPESALDAAAGGGYADIVKRLLDLGAEVEGADDEVTPLMNAAELGHLETVRLLLAAGADPFVSYEGETPLDAARNRGHSAVAELLERAMR